MEVTGQVQQGPPRKSDRQRAETKAMAGLWTWVWEASQFKSADEIRAHVESTLREIESDQP